MVGSLWVVVDGLRFMVDDMRIIACLLHAGLFFIVYHLWLWGCDLWLMICGLWLACCKEAYGFKFKVGDLQIMACVLRPSLKTIICLSEEGWWPVSKLTMLFSLEVWEEIMGA